MPEYTIKLRTGFYQTTLYTLLISPGQIRLSPARAAPGKEIVIPKQNLVSITLTQKQSVEIEFHTLEQVYRGSLTKNSTIKDVHNLLKKHLNTPITWLPELSNRRKKDTHG